MKDKPGISAEQSSELKPFDKETKEGLTTLGGLKQLFGKNGDVEFQQYFFAGHKVHLIVCNGMVNQQLLYGFVIEKLTAFCEQVHPHWNKQDALDKLHVPDIVEVSDANQLLTAIFQGSMGIFFEEKQLLFTANIAEKPNRNPEETKTEVPVKGPRDNFIEDIGTNIALVRKRLPTNSFCVERTHIGRRTKTEVALLYFDDMANQDTVNKIRKKLDEIDVDIMISGTLLMEYIDKSSRLFPRHDYTGRPDHVVDSLVRGRIVLFVDGVSYAVITPITFFLLFKTSEDNEYPTLYGSFERGLRLFGVLIGTMLPAFWLALITFHQNQLPTFLMATVVRSNVGLPFPALVEMILMLLMFEFFREAGLRLPESIGGTLSVVGGLIIGDAAIRAGVTSPAMIVIIAISTIAAFTLINQSLVTTISLLRFFAIILTGFCGLFGFFVALFFIIVHLANIRVFGIPYLDIAEEISWEKFKKTFFRPLQKDFKRRPEVLKPLDKIRQKEASE